MRDSLAVNNSARLGPNVVILACGTRHGMVASSNHSSFRSPYADARSRRKVGESRFY